MLTYWLVNRDSPFLDDYNSHFLLGKKKLLSCTNQGFEHCSNEASPSRNQTWLANPAVDFPLKLPFMEAFPSQAMFEGKQAVGISLAEAGWT
jgi:hypothetical protein